MAKKSQILSDDQMSAVMSILKSSDEIDLQDAVQQVWGKANKTPLPDDIAGKAAEQIYKESRRFFGDSALADAIPQEAQEGYSNIWANTEAYRRENHKRTKATPVPSWMQESEETAAPNVDEPGSSETAKGQQTAQEAVETPKISESLRTRLKGQTPRKMSGRHKKTGEAVYHDRTELQQDINDGHYGTSEQRHHLATPTGTDKSESTSGSEVKPDYEDMTPEQIQEMSSTGTKAAAGKSDYAKKIKSENESFAKANDEYEQKRKNLLEQDGDHRDDLAKLDAEHKALGRAHGVNRIQNAMNAMQNTEALKTAFAAEHAKHPNLTKSNFMQTALDNRGGFLGDQKKLIGAMQDELGLDKAGRAEMSEAISQIGDAGRIAAENQRIARTRYGKFIKAVNSKGGLDAMSNDEMIKLLGLNQKAQDKLFVHDSGLSKEAAEAQKSKVLKNLITKKAEYGEREISKAADFAKRTRAGDAEAIYDATHREGMSRNAASHIAAARKSASKAAGEASKSGKGLGLKAKGGIALGLLALGGVLGSMMGGHGEKTNAEMYNPNPQPQYYS